MHAFAHHALLGSLLAAAAGVLVLITVTIQYGFRRRTAASDELSTEEAAGRLRTMRLADTVTVACFAVAAGLGVVGLMQQTRAAAPAADDPKTAQRLHAIESRLAGAELQLQARSAPPELRAWEDRLARLENRLGAVEDRVVLAERRPAAVSVPSRVPVSTPAPRKAAAVAPSPSIPSASPRLVPIVRDEVKPIDPPAAPNPQASVAPAAPAETELVTPPPAVAAAPPPGTAMVAPPSPPRVAPPVSREPIRPRVEPGDLPLSEKVRQDWETVRRYARRGGDEWRDGWRQLRGLFGN